MTTSSHAQNVSDYYDIHTEPFYIGSDGWDADHLHFGIFTDRPEEEYMANPMLVLEDRKPAIGRMHDSILAPADFKESDVVVDAGCGVGGTAFLINERHGSRVVGLNINQLQVDIATDRAKAAGVEDKVTFQLADCSTSLPLDDNSVDYVVNIASACHYEDRAKFIEECARILKPGGKMIVQDWMEADGISDEERAQFVQPVCDTWLLSKLDSLGSYRELLAANGLETTESEYLEKGVNPNAFLLQAGYMMALQKEQQGVITDYERGNMGRSKSFAEGLLSGRFKIGRYAAVKK